MALIEELTELKKRTERARTDEARLEGQLQQLQEQLKSDFGVAGESEGSDYLGELLRQAEDIKKEVAEGVETIKEELGW